MSGIVAINLGLVLLGLLFDTLAMASVRGPAAGCWPQGPRPLPASLRSSSTAWPRSCPRWRPRSRPPFYWLLGAKPLATGFDWPGLALLAATTLVLLGAAVWAFDRRGIST